MKTTKKTKQLNPGSKEAIEAGCKCPCTDNAYGKGCGWKDTDGAPLFWITENCPIHGGEK